MEQVQSHGKPSFVWRLIKLPIRGLLFLFKHPALTILFALLIAFSSFSYLAHFNPAIAERFNNSVKYFGLATLASAASDTISTLNNAVDLAKKRQALVHADLEGSKKRNLKLDSNSRRQKKVIGLQADAIKHQKTYISKQEMRLVSANKKTADH